MWHDVKGKRERGGGRFGRNRAGSRRLSGIGPRGPMRGLLNPKCDRHSSELVLVTEDHVEVKEGLAQSQPWTRRGGSCRGAALYEAVMVL